jgi:hypothetical protein
MFTGSEKMKLSTTLGFILGGIGTFLLYDYMTNYTAPGYVEPINIFEDIICFPVPLWVIVLGMFFVAIGVYFGLKVDDKEDEE